MLVCTVAGMTPLAYAAEKYWQGVRMLVTDPGRIGERIDHAYRAAMSSAVTPSSDRAGSDLPPDLLGRLRDLASQMTAEPGALGGGSIAATSVLRSEEDAVEVAREMYALAYELQSELDKQRGR